MLLLVIFAVCASSFLSHLGASELESRGQGRMSVFDSKPYVSVAVNTSGCAYDIRVNDVSIINDDQGIPVTVDIPVNHWLQLGENELSMYLTPIPSMDAFNEETACSATLLVRESGSSVDANRPIADIKFLGVLANGTTATEGSSPAGRFDPHGDLQPDESGRVVVGEVTVERFGSRAGVVVHRSIGLPLLLPRWNWIDSDVIPENEETKRELVRAYERIWNAANEKNVDSIMPLFLERSGELAVAFHRSTDEMQRQIGLKDASENPELKLYDLEAEDAELVVFAGGRLAKLTRWDGDQPIVFVYVDESAAECFDVIFRKSGDQWIITR